MKRKAENEGMFYEGLRLMSLQVEVEWKYD